MSDLTPNDSKDAKKRKWESDEKSQCTLECTAFECPICQEMLVEKSSLICKHTFCFSCINQWCTQNPTCPLCRVDVEWIQKIEHSADPVRISSKQNRSAYVERLRRLGVLLRGVDIRQYVIDTIVSMHPNEDVSEYLISAEPIILEMLRGQSQGTTNLAEN